MAYEWMNARADEIRASIGALEDLDRQRTYPQPLEAVLPTLKKTSGQWAFFAFLAEQNIRDMEAELSGTKRVPQPDR